MCSLGAQRIHIYPRATYDDACEDLVDGLIVTREEIRPARAALISPLKMGPTERTQGWFPKNFEHGMRLLEEPLKNLRTFQAHVIKLAMGEGTWAAQCRLVHPNGTVGMPSRKRASHEYGSELTRTGRRLMPVTRRSYLGLPLLIMKPMLAQWAIAFPDVTKGPMDNFVKRREGPAPRGSPLRGPRRPHGGRHNLGRWGGRQAP